jgi:hypothetical protein
LVDDEVLERLPPVRLRLIQDGLQLPDVLLHDDDLLTGIDHVRDGLLDVHIISLRC